MGQIQIKVPPTVAMIPISSVVVANDSEINKTIQKFLKLCACPRNVNVSLGVGKYVSSCMQRTHGRIQKRVEVTGG